MLELGGAFSGLILALGAFAASGGALGTVIVGFTFLVRRLRRGQMIEEVAMGALVGAYLALGILALEETGLL